MYSRIFSSLFSLFLISVLSFVLVGCSSNASGTEEPGGGNNGPGEPEPGVVGMTTSSFTPSDIEIEVGETVTWTNDNSVSHTVTSGSDGEHDGMFDSGNLPPGEEFSYQFDETGTFDYYCIPHLSSGMTGTVTVVASGS